PVAKRFGGFRRIGLHKAGVAMRQVDCKEVDLALYAGNLRHRLAKVRLRMAGIMPQRYEDLELHQRDGMGQAARKWHHRRCSQLMECPDAPAERPRPSLGQALSRSLVALDQDSTIIAV